ncbi:MAG: polyisoprenoid-binding protein [Gammaproteobacteria bacterium]|nr:polyisoprenoid-binding protein [Gammaproteobacteria bacterium]
MRKSLLLIAVSVLPATALAAPAFYTVDPAHTYPHFAISHLGFSTMHGRFNTTEGKITVDLAGKTGSVDIKIDANSVDTGFKKRDDHLRSPDFLNAAEFPAITYKSSKVVISGDSSATVDGTLTIMGVSKPVTLAVDHIQCGANPMNKKEMCGFNATATIKRSDFGVNYALPAVGDEMKITLEVEALKD